MRNLTGLVIVSILLGWPTVSQARSPKSHVQTDTKIRYPQRPDMCATEHRVNSISLIVQNNGKFGATSYDYIAQFGFRDCLTNERMYQGVEYPITSRLRYMYQAGIWVGGIQDEDTLVSAATFGYPSWYQGAEEFAPIELPDGWIQHFSSTDTAISVSEGAVSEQDFIVTYADTVDSMHYDWTQYFYKPRPLNIKVTQSSYAWSYPYCRDFIFINFVIENIGHEYIHDGYFGLWVEPDCGLVAYHARSTPDMGGLIKYYPSFQGCNFEDKLNLAWFADVSGDPFQGEFIDYVAWVEDTSYKSITDVVGFQFLDEPVFDSKTSYNWWTWWSYPGVWGDFGPRSKYNFRDFGTGELGEPEGDRNRYHVLSNGELDYDLVMTNKIATWEEPWLYPRDRAMANLLSSGSSQFEVLLSIGPFDLPPGTEIHIPMALVGGEKFHTDPTNYERNLPYNQTEYYKHLDFSDLASNAMWARWVYDNPGVDTDGDGFYGKYRVCRTDSIWDQNEWIITDADTSWYQGDGVPDWRAAIPPTAPKVWIQPTLNGIHVRFNGARTETERDPLTNIVDFEGYNIWIARDERKTSYSLVASCDLVNLDKFYWDPKIDSRGNYVLNDIPRSADYWRCTYGGGTAPCENRQFDPLVHNRNNPFFHPDFPESTFYFAPHHYNAPVGTAGGIKKAYPEAKKPPTNFHPDSLGLEYFTEDGYLKYYEYEFTIENLLVTVPYYINVTAFDFGSPAQGLSPLETSKTEGALNTFPATANDQLSGEPLQAYVYPNPYRLDGEYRAHGYEGRTQPDLPDDKVRSVHFNNLPSRCWIRIYSLDGDLVRELRHECEDSDPNRFHARWDMINRNRGGSVTGLYYWVVEDDNGSTQMGKLAVIL
ncbi:MAG: hypothetical protein P1R58_09420 [bacterium]|nr:hypothetical protein [bacterium]